MAKLKVNNQVVEQYIDPTKPLSIVEQYVAEFYGSDCEFSIELSDTEQQMINRIQVRSDVEKQVADSQSLLGTTSDTTHLLLNELSGFVNKLSEADNLEDVKASVISLKATIGDIEGLVATGELTFPYQSKGLDTVKQEIIERANGVNNLL
ncbi:hypothetical protein PRUB_a3477 [Pseudoalteromonas rubra]|uniref:Uncharacterized protein n=1 Tax=Pseudoalteromonas rubra TaxID=43658 RepID=A0A8T0C2R0_9GAMM|nr:hypothetical protein [Pseudoalteromonas rubra]KAF7783649.1 hypothetical protein PRUB_a3477 [Pseudoalteromonas rubra]